MAEAYELQYKKVHNTLEKPAGDSVYGNQVGQRVNNLLAPKITMESLAPYSVDPIENSPYALQVTPEHLQLKNFFVNSDFYQPEIEYKLDTANNNYAAKPSCLSRYKRHWYQGTVTNAAKTFCPLTSSFQDGYARSSLVSGTIATDLVNYAMICSHKILVDVSKNYMFQLCSGSNSLPTDWKIGFQLMCENVAEGTITGGPSNSKHYTQAYTQLNNSAIINGWNGKPIAINLNKIMDEATLKMFTDPLQYTYVQQDYVNQWAPWQKARYQYLIVYLFIKNPAEVSLAENYQFFLYKGEEVAILDHQGTILGFTGETPLTLKLSTGVKPVALWTLQDSGIFTDQNFKPSFEISTDGDLVLKLAAVQTTSENDLTLKDILTYLKATNKELVAVPYIDYNVYDENKGKTINKTRSLKYKNTGVKRMYTESNWVKYINVVRSEKDKNHFYETNEELTWGTKKGRYSSYVCNPDVHIGAYRFDYFINNGDIDTSVWSIPFSHASNSAALPSETTEPYNAYYLKCLSFDNSVFKVAQPKEYVHNEKPIFITLPKDVTQVTTVFKKKYHFTPVIKTFLNGQVIDFNTQLPPANPPTRPDITILAKAPRRAASTKVDLDNLKPIQPVFESESFSAFVKQDKHLYLRPVKAGDPMPGLQIFGNCRAHPMEPDEEDEVFAALDVATKNTSLNHSAIKWVKMFFQWEVWEWGNKKRLNDPVIGDRFGLWGRNDVVFKKEAMMNINHSPFIYVAQACSWCDSSTAVGDKIPFYFEWQDITFAKTESGDIIAFPSSWIKKP